MKALSQGGLKDIDWDAAIRIGRQHSAKLRPKSANDRWSLWKNDRRAWRLFVTAAVLEGEIAELDGWLAGACGDLQEARDRNAIRTTPGAFFRGCLARWLEYRGYCPERGGMHLVGCLQNALLVPMASYEHQLEGQT